jgi:prepilin-type N-terminal cleavage/methylation domain-containing protein
MLTRIRHHVRTRGSVEGGFTLVELLVVIVLIGVVGAISLAATLSALETQQTTDGLVTARNEGSKVVERVSRDARTANPLRVAEADELTLDTYRGSTCERRRYYVDGTALKLDVSSFASGVQCNQSGAAPGAASTTVVTPNLETSGTPLFQYLRWDAAVGERVVVAAPVASASIGTVDAVLITATVPAQDRPAVVVSSQVDLRNVETV